MNSDDFLAGLETRLLRPKVDLTELTPEEQFARITEKVASLPQPVITREDLLERLRRARRLNAPLKVKFGIDPTGPDIHVGHAVPLLAVRLFQRMGHEVDFVIGDFTGMVGDPSGRSDARPALTEADVARNMESYEAQASRVVDLNGAGVRKHFNSTWMGSLTLKDWLGVLKRISASELLQREDFRTRLSAGQGLSMAELEYSLFMGYDSVALKSDVELGGQDQFLNMHMCRKLMEAYGLRPEVIVAYNLLAGTTGEKDPQGRFVKMSKSRGNYLAVTTEPRAMYGKVMSIPDDVMWLWYRELTEACLDDIAELNRLVTDGKVHPKSAKQLLARAVVSTFHYRSEAAVADAERDFNDKFGSTAALVPESTVDVSLEGEELFRDFIARVAAVSKSQSRRLVEQQAVRVLRGDEYKPCALEDLERPAKAFAGEVLRIGKKQFVRVAQSN
jgi:tyrosyl-tRNA synthetase